MAIKGFLKQTCTYEKYIERDARGAIRAEPPRTIRCRKVTKQKWQRTKGEMILVAVTQFTTLEEVRLGDQLDGEEIYAVEDIIGRNGKRLATKSFPRPPQGFTP